MRSNVSNISYSFMPVAVSHHPICAGPEAATMARATLFRSVKRGKNFLDGLQLVAGGGGGDQDRGRDAAIAPPRDSVAHRRVRAEQRRIGEPAVSHQARDVVLAPVGERGLYRAHFLDVTG